MPRTPTVEAPTRDLLCFSLYSAHHAMNRAYAERLGKWNLTYPQYLVLVLLWAKGSQLVGDLAKELRLTYSTLTPLIKRLEKAGYVSRKRDTEDERQVHVSLTAKGRGLRKKAECIPENILAHCGLTDSEVRALNEGLHALTEVLLTPER